MAKAALNAARMKERNYRRFLRELRINPMTRSQMARIMGITRSATSLIAEDMLSTGIITEGSLSQDGKNTTKALSWNKDYFHVAGINLGRDTVTTGITDFCGNVFDSISFPTSDCSTPKKVLDRAAQYIVQMIATHKPAGKLLGIGIASPGPLDTKAGIIMDPPYFDLFHNTPVAQPLREMFRCDAVLENDANALALAEKCYGLADRYERFLELMVDIGIGASLILDNKLNKGPTGFGNGFGHTSIDINGPRCVCGNIGCLEMYASIPCIVETAKAADPSLNSWRVIVDRAYAEDRVALDILHIEARYLATVIVNASNVLDIQAVVFSGDYVLYRPTMLLELVENEVNKRVTSRGERTIEILPSQIPSEPKVLACTNLTIDRYLERPFIFSNPTHGSEGSEERPYE
jgi:predicted NBD/HSP70 family sugar kinase